MADKGFFQYIKNFTDYKMFSIWHILFFVFALIISITLAIVLRKKSDKTKRIILIVAACIIILNFVILQIWRIWAYADGRAKGFLDLVAYIVMPNEILPFQLCSMLCYAIPFAVFTKKQWAYNALAPICIIGGFLFFFFPDGIVNRYAPYSFRVLESILQHTVILFFGLYLLISKQVKLDMKNIAHPFIVMASGAVLAIVANSIFAPVDNMVNFFYIRKDIFGLGLHPILTTLIMGIVFTGLIFAIYGVQQLCYFLARKMSKKNKKIEV